MSWPAAAAAEAPGTCLLQKKQKDKKQAAWKKWKKRQRRPNDNFVCMFVIRPAPLFKVYKDSVPQCTFRACFADVFTQRADYP